MTPTQPAPPHPASAGFLPCSQGVSAPGRLASVLVLALVLLGTAGAAGARQGSPPVAVLSEARGAVEVRTRGAKSFVVVHGRRALGDGDTVRVRAGGAAVLTLGGVKRALKPGDLVLVSAAKAWTARPGRPLPERREQSVLGALGRAARTVPSAATSARPDKDPEFRALSPCEDTLLDGRPSLSWTPLAGALKYEIVVEDSGGKEVWTASLRGAAQLVYPAGRAPLEPGDYRWTVTAFPPNGDASPASSGFRLPSPEQARKASAAVADARRCGDGKNPNLALIAVYLEYGLYTKAEGALTEALARGPDDAALRLLLAHALFAMKRPAAGKAEYERAAALARSE
jgi:hypothetical protein